MKISLSAQADYFARGLRTWPPEESLSRIQPVFSRLGITRLANVTGLDDLGLPVWQAIRPNARLLSVSQGKGVTHSAAKVSAAMESIELWHAEHLPPASIRRPAGEVKAELGYRIEQLPMASRHCLGDNTVLDWFPGTMLLDGSPTLVPDAYLRLDGRVRETWYPPVFQASTNGLASGNVLEEAILHGLLEVIEREAMAETAGRLTIASASVTGMPRAVLQAIQDAGHQVHIEYLPNAVGLACFGVQLRRDDMSAVFDGYGCHLDRDVALVRALTEAAQSRVTAIAGTRDDIHRSLYRGSAALQPEPQMSSSTGPGAPIDIVPTLRVPHLEEAITHAAKRVQHVTGHSPMMVDLTRPELQIPVVRIICPGLRCPAKF
jgi:YcaO-like protein with predicted kinase domain